MTKEKAKEIIYNLDMTISKMSTDNGIQSKNAMFKKPRAKRSELIKIKNNLIKKYKL